METVNDRVPWPAIVGYSNQASGGMIDPVDGVVADDEEWGMRCCEFDVLNWLPGNQVLVAPASTPDKVITPEHDVDPLKDRVNTRSSGRPRSVRRGQGFCTTLLGWSGI